MFKNFIEEITAISQAGYYDSRHSYISNDFSENKLVIRHENIHKQMMTLTSDGQLLGTLNYISNNKSFVESDRTSAKKIFNWMYRQSLTTHEALATYLSVTDFDVSQQALVINQLPKTYKKYYESISSVVNSIIPTSYLQYTIVYAIGSLALSSNLFTRIIGNGLKNIELNDYDSTNLRFNKLLERFKQEIKMENFLEVIIHDVKDELNKKNYPNFDITIEEKWQYDENILSEELYLKRRRIIENEVTKIVQNRLSQTSAIYPFYITQEWIIDNISFFEKFNLNQSLIKQYNEGENKTYNDAYLASNSRIYNDKIEYLKPENWPLIEDNDILTMLYFDILSDETIYVCSHWFETSITKFKYHDKSISFNRTFSVNKIIMVMAIEIKELFSCADNVVENGQNSVPSNFVVKKGVDTKFYTLFYLSGNLFEFFEYFIAYRILNYSNNTLNLEYKKGKIIVFLDKKGYYYFKYFNDIDFYHILSYITSTEFTVKFSYKELDIPFEWIGIISEAMSKTIRAAPFF